MNTSDSGNVLIGLAGSPATMRNAVNFLREVGGIRVISPEKLLKLTETPPGVTIVPEVASYAEKMHLMGIMGYLIWAPPSKKTEFWELKEEPPRRVGRKLEFDSLDCHFSLEVDRDWRGQLWDLQNALQLRTKQS